MCLNKVTISNKLLSRVPGVSKQTGSPDSAAQLSVSWWFRAPDEAATGCITQWSWCDIWPQRPQPQLLKGKSNQCSIDSVRARWKPNYRPSRHSWSFYAASQIKPVLCTIALLCSGGGWPSSPPQCCYGKNSHLSFFFCLFVYIQPKSLWWTQQKSLLQKLLSTTPWGHLLKDVWNIRALSLMEK